MKHSSLNNMSLSELVAVPSKLVIMKEKIISFLISVASPLPRPAPVQVSYKGVSYKKVCTLKVIKSISCSTLVKGEDRTVSIPFQVAMTVTTDALFSFQDRSSSPPSSLYLRSLKIFCTLV